MHTKATDRVFMALCFVFKWQKAFHVVSSAREKPKGSKGLCCERIDCGCGFLNPEDAPKTGEAILISVIIPVPSSL